LGGFFGIISRADCVSDLFYGTDYNSHLGTKRGGMAVLSSKEFKRAIHNIENSYFRTKFEPDLSKMYGNSGIGVISDGGTNLSELIAMLIDEESSFERGIENVFDKVKGSCSILLLTREGLYAARDKLGRTPVVIGRKEGAFAASSESSAFFNLGYKTEKFLGPGEIVFMTAEGYEQRRKPNDKMQICAFLWVYYGYPSSDYEGINVEECRYRCGAALAKDDTVDVDFAAGIPDSGIAHGLGYATEKKIPFKRPYVKYTPTWPRSFMPQSQEVRDLVAKMKLIPVESLISGKKIVFCDDSIVRGTQLKETVQILYDFGVKEVHIRPACPTLIYPCTFLNFSRSRSTLDLAGRKAIQELEGTDEVDLAGYAIPGTEKYEAMIEKIRKRINVTTLKYQRLDDLIEAIGLPKDKVCTHCWDGTSYY